MTSGDRLDRFNSDINPAAYSLTAPFSFGTITTQASFSRTTQFLFRVDF